MKTYEKLPGGCSPPNASAVIALIQRYGVWGLGGCDGCDCAHFEILAFHVDVSCRKSEHSVRVYSYYLGADREDCRDIASVVLSQLDYPERYRVRFCEWKTDNTKPSPLCCYCAKPRAGEDDYLCLSCQRKPDALAAFPLELGRPLDAVGLSEE